MTFSETKRDRLPKRIQSYRGWTIYVKESDSPTPITYVARLGPSRLTARGLDLIRLEIDRVAKDPNTELILNMREALRKRTRELKVAKTLIKDLESRLPRVIVGSSPAPSCSCGCSEPQERGPGA